MGRQPGTGSQAGVPSSRGATSPAPRPRAHTYPSMAPTRNSPCQQPPSTLRHLRVLPTCAALTDLCCVSRRLYDADEDKPETEAPLGQTPRTETAPETVPGDASSNRANLQTSSHAVTSAAAPNGATAEPIICLNLFRRRGPTASPRHMLLDTVVPSGILQSAEAVRLETIRNIK